MTKYLYTVKFNWTVPSLQREFGDEPKKGRVYRANYNPHDISPYLLITNSTPIGFESLSSTNEVADFEFKELTAENILDFDIVEEDLELMNKWFESKGEDVFTEEKFIPEGLTKLKEALHSHTQDESEALAYGTQTIMNLWVANPDKFNVMMDFIEYLTQADLNSYSEPSTYLRLHEKYGLGINVSKALEALNRYAGDDRRTNEDMDDLHRAMEAITVELERTIDNDFD